MKLGLELAKEIEDHCNQSDRYLWTHLQERIPFRQCGSFSIARSGLTSRIGITHKQCRMLRMIGGQVTSALVSR